MSMALNEPVRDSIRHAAFMLGESMNRPVGETTKMAIETFPPCAFVPSTHESTMALAVSALMTFFINVRFATSGDTVTFERGAGVLPWARRSPATDPNATVNKTITPTPKHRVFFIMVSSLATCLEGEIGRAHV